MRDLYDSVIFVLITVAIWLAMSAMPRALRILFLLAVLSLALAMLATPSLCGC